MDSSRSASFKTVALLALGAFVYSYIHFSFPNASYTDIDDYFFAADEDRHSQNPAILQLGGVTLQIPSLEFFQLLPTGRALQISQYVALKACRGPPPSETASF